MTTNQTIDGVLVPRELLERLANAPSIRAHGEALDELRALLDAPAVESELSRMTRRCKNAELALKVQTENYEALKASQPQGEPVALLESVIGKKPQAFLTEPVYQVTESEVREFARLLAEQPAPVAGVPEDIYAVLNELIKHAGWAICSYQRALSCLPKDLDDLSEFLERILMTYPSFLKGSGRLIFRQSR